jgi:hypothetical protein
MSASSGRGQAAGGREIGASDDKQRTLFPQVRGNYGWSRKCAESLAKVGVAGSNPVVRSKNSRRTCRSAVRHRDRRCAFEHVRFRAQAAVRLCGPALWDSSASSTRAMYSRRRPDSDLAVERHDGERLRVGVSGTIATGSNTTLCTSTVDTLTAMVHSIDPQYRTKGASWLKADGTLSTIRKFRTGLGGSLGAYAFPVVFTPSPTAGIPGGLPDLLLGFRSIATRTSGRSADGRCAHRHEGHEHPVPEHRMIERRPAVDERIHGGGLEILARRIRERESRPTRKDKLVTERQVVRQTSRTRDISTIAPGAIADGIEAVRRLLALHELRRTPS